MRILIVALAGACSASATPAKPVTIEPCSPADVPTLEAALRLCPALYFESIGCTRMVIVSRPSLYRAGLLRGRIPEEGGGHWRVDHRPMLHRDGTISGATDRHQLDANGAPVPRKFDLPAHSCIPGFAVTVAGDGVFEVRATSEMSPGRDVWYVDKARCMSAKTARTTPLVAGGC